MDPAPDLMTAEEFLRLHGDEYGVELVDGRVVRFPPAGCRNAEVCAEVAFIVGDFVKSHSLGRAMICDTTIPTGPYSVRGADFCYFSFNRLPKETPTPLGAADVPPELVIEVRPPSDCLSVVIKKIDEYVEAGVDVVVLLEPDEKTATIFRKCSDQRLFAEDQLTLPDILPGFSVPVRKFFE